MQDKIKVLESFSGIGAQRKALKNIGARVDVVGTIEWGIHSILAYDLIHNGVNNDTYLDGCQKKDLAQRLFNIGVSSDGKKPMTLKAINALSIEVIKAVLYAIDRTKNLVDIVKVKGDVLPNDLDILTYSFPCQDISIANILSGKYLGLSKNLNTRSGMLWEIERILGEMETPPRALLMENVPSIMSRRHQPDFNSWKDFLSRLGYINFVYKLVGTNHGVPQNRTRVFMLSFRLESKEHEKSIIEYFVKNNLEKYQTPLKALKEFLKTDYTNPIYKKESDILNSALSPSTPRIFNNSVILFDGTNYREYTRTITTEQILKTPNAGLIMYDSDRENRSPYRFLTARECFLLMGFNEEDYNILLENNPMVNSKKRFYRNSHLTKLAGNSIIVPILENVFTHMVNVLMLDKID